MAPVCLCMRQSYVSLPKPPNVWRESLAGQKRSKKGVCVTKTREIFFGKRCSIAAKAENGPENTLSWMHNRKKSDGNRDKNYGNKDSFFSPYSRKRLKSRQNGLCTALSFFFCLKDNAIGIGRQRQKVTGAAAPYSTACMSVWMQRSSLMV